MYRLPYGRLFQGGFLPLRNVQGTRKSFLPAERIDQVFHIIQQKTVHDAQRIGIGCGIEIKCPTQKMAGGIGHKELVGRCHITPQSYVQL